MRDFNNNSIYDVTKEQQLDFIDHYCTNPIDSAFDLLDLDLWWGQRKIVKSIWESLNVMIIGARGIGKTYLLGVIALLRALLVPGEKVVLTAASFRQSKFIFAEIEKIYAKNSILRESCVKPPSRMPDACRLTFLHGSSIIALPLGDGSTIRGERANSLIIDETAQVPEDIINDVLIPMMNTETDPMENVKRIRLIKKMEAAGKDTAELRDMQKKHPIIMASTAYFSFNHLYKRYVSWKNEADAGNNEYAVHSYNYLDPPEGFLDLKKIDIAKRDQPLFKFQMENLSIFPQDSANFYPASLLEKIKSNDCPILLSATGKGIYVIGIDPARTSDNFTISVLKIEGEIIKLVFMKAFNNVPTNYSAYYVRMLESLFHPICIAIDKGGGGMGVYDELNRVIDKDNVLLNLPKIENEVEIDKISYWGRIDLLENETLEDKGSKIKYLIKLIDFTSEWLLDSNYKLKSKMQTAKPTILIPQIISDSIYKSKNELETEKYEDALFNVQKFSEEILNIKAVATRSGKAVSFIQDNRNILRDRYSSFLVASYVADEFIRDKFQPKTEKKKQLAIGKWL